MPLSITKLSSLIFFVFFSFVDVMSTMENNATIPPEDPPPPLPTTINVGRAPSLASTPTGDATKINLQEAGWSDIYEDGVGVAAGVAGYPFDEISAKPLRNLCGSLRIKNVRNAKKADMVKRIEQTYELKKYMTTDS